MDPELDRIDLEIAKAKASLRAGEPREDMILLGLHDWYLERRMLVEERDEMASKYIRDNFRPEDRIAVVLLNRATAQAQQRVKTVERASDPAFQKWLRYMNVNKHEVYVSMNTVQPGATGRRREEIGEIRHIYLDIDEKGPAVLAALKQRPDIPPANHVMESSPGRYQAIWRVNGFDPDRAERLMRNLAVDVGADIRATDCSRVLRAPGFYSHKYEEPHFVSVQNLSDKVHGPEQFPAYTIEREQDFRRTIANSSRPAGSPITQSERDWAFAHRALARGEDYGSIVQQIIQTRSDKPNAVRYAERTVGKAQEQFRARGR